MKKKTSSSSRRWIPQTVSILRKNLAHGFHHVFYFLPWLLLLLFRKTNQNLWKATEHMCILQHVFYYKNRLKIRQHMRDTRGRHARKVGRPQPLVGVCFNYRLIYIYIYMNIHLKLGNRKYFSFERNHLFNFSFEK